MEFIADLLSIVFFVIAIYVWWRLKKLVKRYEKITDELEADMKKAREEE